MEDGDDDRFLPDDDRGREDEDEIFISPALRALMNKYASMENSFLRVI